MPTLRYTMRRLTRSLQSRSDAVPDLRVRVASVIAVASTAARDGTTLVTINLGGSTQPCARLAAYSSPVVGDMVAVLLVDKSPLILGKVVGLPNV